MVNYKLDVATIIGEWDQLVTVKRQSVSYSDSGKSTITWATVTTAMVDIQPITDRARMSEVGMKEISSHIVYGYYNVSGVKIDVKQSDRIYDASSNIYEVTYVSEYTDSHLEIHVKHVEGKL